ncbi:MAG: inositol monophosphatase family protein [Angustibacter sp.]
MAAREAMTRAAEIMSEAHDLSRTYKTDRDYATSTDFAIEDALRALLERLAPGIGFLGEERGHTGRRDRYWCLDPVDGTTNYSRSIPNYGNSLALIDGGQPVLGAIALPAHGESYLTRSGVAYLNDQPIEVESTASISEAIVAVGDFATGPGSAEKNHQRIATLTRLADTVGRVRMLGSAATDFAWLAAGRLDAVVVQSNHVWDVAAGVAMARAAGAFVTHTDGSPYSLTGPDVLASTPRLHGKLVRHLVRD